MVEIFKFNQKEWDNLLLLKGSADYMRSLNDERWSDAMRAEEQLFSDIVAKKRRTA